uniref:Uncharacterized protein n=1 Tax=Branchiostoma floridae TaxID=7739 RepID=C3XTT8_BRAFL|eukprot:XP_002612303.1 hypothetical protein BRAFLDRAFT_80083 [Branchiostoma floridae]
MQASPVRRDWDVPAPPAEQEVGGSPAGWQPPYQQPDLVRQQPPINQEQHSRARNARSGSRQATGSSRPPGSGRPPGPAGHRVRQEIGSGRKPGPAGHRDPAVHRVRQEAGIQQATGSSRAPGLAGKVG